MPTADPTLMGVDMSPFQHCVRFAGPALVGVCLLAAPATAQPTKQQQDALRSSCRSDYMANCMSVKPGGAEALQCLKRNMAKLSPGCQSAVNALSPPAAPPQQATIPPPAPVTAPPPATAAAPAAPPPRAAVTPPPRAAASPPPPKPARAAPAKAAKAAVHPNSQQQAALRQACQSDFMARCKGVQPGGADAMRCLQRNASRLSPRCQGALSMLGVGAPAAMSAPEATAAPAAAPSAEQIAGSSSFAGETSCFIAARWREPADRRPWLA